MPVIVYNKVHNKKVASDGASIGRDFLVVEIQWKFLAARQARCVERNAARDGGIQTLYLAIHG